MQPIYSLGIYKSSNAFMDCENYLLGNPSGVTRLLSPGANIQYATPSPPVNLKSIYFQDLLVKSCVFAFKKSILPPPKRSCPNQTVPRFRLLITPLVNPFTFSEKKPISHFWLVLKSLEHLLLTTNIYPTRFSMVLYPRCGKKILHRFLATMKIRAALLAES